MKTSNKIVVRTALITTVIILGSLYLSKQYWGIHKSDEATDELNASGKKGRILKKIMGSDKPYNPTSDKIRNTVESTYGENKTVVS